MYTDNSFLYSDVSLSSSYEAAKAAYAKAVNAETEISKTNEEVALKASKNEVTETLKGYATTASMNAAITTKANEITSSVAANYTTKNEFDSLHIGGTNLIPGSGKTASIVYASSGDGGDNASHFEHGDDYPNRWSRFTAASNSSVPRCHLNLFSKTRPGNIYTFSADVQIYQNYVRIGIIPCTSDFTPLDFNYYTDSPIANASMLRVSVTSEKLPTNAAYVYLYIESHGGERYFDVRKLKLEEGNKATAWSPAPEDIESRVASAET